MRRKYFLLAALLLVPALRAQTPAWVKIATEGQTITSIAPGAVLRFGHAPLSDCPAGSAGWQTIVATPLPLDTSDLYETQGDPCPNVVKEIDAQEQSAPTTFTGIDSAGVAFSTTIAGYGPPLTIPTAPGAVYQFTLSNLNIPAGTIDVMIDGVTFVCVFGPDFTTLAIPLTCTVSGNKP